MRPLREQNHRCEIETLTALAATGSGVTAAGEYCGCIGPWVAEQPSNMASFGLSRLYPKMISKTDLDAHSPVPLYRQLYDHFRASIESGKLENGSRLPATRELAGQLGLNRTTVASAYELLENEGFLTGQVGRGSFVRSSRAPRQNELDWNTLVGSTQTRTPAYAGQNPATISFATSRPSEDLFPLEAFRLTCNEVLSGRHLPSVLQLGSPGGYEPLRRYLLDRAAERGLCGAGGELMVTSGCQQAFDLIARALLRPGDKVAVEDPVYPGLKNLFLNAGVELLGIPVGTEGMDTGKLASVLTRHNPKLIVVTPNFQNPTGATMPLAARRATLRLAREHGAVLVESDIYGELMYSGEAIPSIRQLDETGGTVLLRSFSKVAFPGLRVGWILGPRPLISRCCEIKQITDLHTDQLSQAVLLRFGESGRLEEHRKAIVSAGAERLAATLAACGEFLPRNTQFTRPRGGMNVWVRLPEPLDAGELLPRAQRENVTYLPGRYFTVSKHEPGGMRLSFAGLTPASIREGIRTLGVVFSSELESTRSRGMEPASAIV